MNKPEYLKAESPYKYHKSYAREFNITSCCMSKPEETDMKVFYHNPFTDLFEWLELKECPKCKAKFVSIGNRCKKLDNILKYDLKQV